MSDSPKVVEQEQLSVWAAEDLYCMRPVDGMPNETEPLVLDGLVLKFGVKGRSGRVYPVDALPRMLDHVQPKIQERSLFGMCHMDLTDLFFGRALPLKDTAFSVESMTGDSDGCLKASIRVLDTPAGQQLTGLYTAFHAVTCGWAVVSHPIFHANFKAKGEIDFSTLVLDRLDVRLHPAAVAFFTLTEFKGGDVELAEAREQITKMRLALVKCRTLTRNQEQSPSTVRDIGLMVEGIVDDCLGDSEWCTVGTPGSATDPLRRALRRHSGEERG